MIISILMCAFFFLQIYIFFCKYVCKSTSASAPKGSTTSSSYDGSFDMKVPTKNSGDQEMFTIISQGGFNVKSGQPVHLLLYAPFLPSNLNAHQDAATVVVSPFSTLVQVQS